MRGRTLMLAGVAAITIAAPAFAVDGPNQLPVPTAVPTVRVPLPTAVPTTVPVPVPTVRVPVPTAVPTAVPTVRVPLPTAAPPVVGGGGGSSGGGSSGGGSASGGSASGGGSSTGSSRPASSGGGSGGGSSGGGGSSSGGGSTSGAGATPSDASSRGGAGRGTASAGGSASRSATPAQARAERVQQREQQLQSTVTRRQACLGDLSRPQRRVLVLRAGVGAGPPLSRTRVARRLDTSVKRVARLERSGLRRLRGLCGGGTATGDPSSAPSATLAADVTGRVSSGGSSSSGGASGGGATGGGHATGGSHADGGASGGHSSKGSHGGVAGVSQAHLPGNGGGLNLTVPVILFVLAGAAWALARVLRRRSEPVLAAADSATPAAPEPPPSAMPNWMEEPAEWSQRPPASRR